MQNLELNLQNYETEDIEAALDILEEEVEELDAFEVIAAMREEIQIEEEVTGIEIQGEESQVTE